MRRRWSAAGLVVAMAAIGVGVVLLVFGLGRDEQHGLLQARAFVRQAQLHPPAVTPCPYPRSLCIGQVTSHTTSSFSWSLLVGQVLVVIGLVGVVLWTIAAVRTRSARAAARP